MHLKVQEGVGAEGQDVFPFIPSWVEASHEAKPCWGEGGSLEGGQIKKELSFQNELSSEAKCRGFYHLQVDLQQRLASSQLSERHVLFTGHHILSFSWPRVHDGYGLLGFPGVVCQVF